MYRDDHEAARQRLDAVQRELDAAKQHETQDKQQIAMLTAQLQAAHAALSRFGQYYPQYPMYPQYIFPPRSGTILTLGILSLVVCAICGPIAWSMGNEEIRRIEAGQTPPDGMGSVTAGRTCGIIGTVVMIVSFMVMMLVFASAGGSRY